VVDAAHPGIVYSEETLELTVTTPPGFVARYLWEIAGAIILLILAAFALYLRHRKRRQAVDVRGLYVTIRRNGERVGAELKAPNKRAETFRFVIRDEGEPTERLDYPKPEDSVYTARRAGTGQVDVVTAAGERYRVTIGGSGEPLPSGLQLAFRDVRKAPSRRTPRLNGDRASAHRRPPAPEPADQGPVAAPSPPDPWLT
jgi:hypothetical protein